MSNIAIKVENLSKAYQLGQIGTGTISRDLERWYARVRGKEDPFLKIGEVNDRDTKGTSDVVWSLKDINFEIEQGDAVGIIGRNGAGKSTLLKILSKVTAPTTGRISGKGRIASLLEVGTGFHPELSGRENIFLNGAILGMRKKEIQRKLEEIVDFAGIERYIDTPVKRYSSGMYVRLAFAVAAHLESEILIVDEVLAVGDAEFQKKCLGKMKDVSNGEGRTVLFVSHNIGAIISLCKSGIYLKNGNMIVKNSVDEIVKIYSQDRNINLSSEIKIFNQGKKVWLSNLKIGNCDDNEKLAFENKKIISFEIEATVNLKKTFVGIGISDLNDARVLTLFSRFFHKSFELQIGTNVINCEVESLSLKPGTYKAEIFIGNDFETFDYYDYGYQFEIPTSLVGNFIMPDTSQGSVFFNQKWSQQNAK